jgi:cytochrome c biogenesis factor
VLFGLGLALSSAGAAGQIAFIIQRTMVAGFLPFASRFEALTLFALAVELCGLAAYAALRRDSVKAGTDIAGTVLLGAGILVPGRHPAADMNPILASPFFASHVLLAFFGYGMLVLGLVWAVCSIFDRGVAETRAILRRLAGLAAFLLGAGIVLGAFWADVAWGNWWSWDPKESWALLTWMVLVLYLHVPEKPGRRWTGVLFFGAASILMLFTFVGINVLKWGAHRY